MQVSLTPIKDAGGFITNYVAVLQDVTERKSSEAAFKLRDHALSNLSEASALFCPALPKAISAACKFMPARHNEGLQRAWGTFRGG